MTLEFYWKSGKDMTKIFNLNKKRKAKNKADKEKKAAENRIKHGRTKQEKKAAKQEDTRQKNHLDGHKLEKYDKKEDLPGK